SLMGIEFLEYAGGQSRVRITVGDQHTNYAGRVHGGVISGLIDAAAGSAVGSLRTSAEIVARPHATSDLHVTYIAAPRGNELVARAKVLKSGRTALFVEVEVRDVQERLVARGSVTYLLAAPRDSAPGK